VVIDIGSRKVVQRFDFGHGVRPHCVVMNPSDGLLYVTTELDRTVTIIDPKTLKLVGTIPTGQDESHMLVLSHDGRFGYTANVGPGTVSVLDLQARRLISVIPVSQKTQRISISVDDRTVFTADQTKPRLAVIDTTTNKLKTWIHLSASGYGTATTRDGRWILVAMQSTSQVGSCRPANFAGHPCDRRTPSPARNLDPARQQYCVRFLHQERQDCRD